MTAKKKQITTIKEKVRAAMREAGTYSKERELEIEIAAGYGLAHKKLLVDIEALTDAIVRDGEDMDFVAALDESIRVLPAVAENYRKALVGLGLAAEAVAEPTAKVGRPAKPAAPVTDADALAVLMSKTTGEV